MARQLPESLGGQANDKAAEHSMRHAALLKSLEYLYFEACSAKNSLVATLIGAAVEALKDDLAAMSGVTRPVAATGTIQIVDTSIPRMLVDDDQFPDDDMWEIEDEDESDGEDEDDRTN